MRRRAAGHNPPPPRPSATSPIDAGFRWMSRLYAEALRAVVECFVRWLALPRLDRADVRVRVPFAGHVGLRQFPLLPQRRKCRPNAMRSSGGPGWLLRFGRPRPFVTISLTQMQGELSQRSGITRGNPFTSSIA
jgi:hypothetical protein